MSPIQQMLLGVGASTKATYIDDVFSTFLYTPTQESPTNGSANLSINNSIDLTEGGLVWLKNRGNGSKPHQLYDTERGIQKVLQTNANSAEGDYTGSGWTNYGLQSFNNNGFTLGTNISGENWPNFEMSSWTFRKAKGFFDVVTYTGNSTNRSIAHNLGSTPGVIIVKCLESSVNWQVWHRGLGNGINNQYDYALKLNSSDGASSGVSTIWYQNPTSTHFSVGTGGGGNADGQKFVAYLFAGGESTNALARSVSFDSSSEYLEIGDSTDFDMGATFTIEAWVKPDFSNNKNYNNFFVHGTLTLSVRDNGNFEVEGFGGDCRSSNDSVPEGQWTHVALVVNSGTANLYVNGIRDQSHERTGINLNNSGDVYIAKSSFSTAYPYTGEISNLRYVKGTAVYTSSFRPPTEPLTNITNTKLLCCNNSSTTGSTVTPNTITANGSPTASTDSPFDDPAGFVFGENEDQNAIACGSYIGTGSNPGPEIILNWEPEFILVKRTDSNSDWYIFDATRGIINNSYRDHILKPNENDAETQVYTMRVQGSGFLYRGTYADVNADGGKYIYMAIRSATGSVKRPPSLGTDVFAMALGTGSSTIPTFVSSFRTDFAFYTNATSNGDKIWTTRNSGSDYILSDSDATSASSSNFTEWDSMTGWATNLSSSNRSYMWKRHKGLDCLHYFGTGSITAQVHNLGQAPEMMFIKRLDGSTQDWIVYHKALASNVVLQLNLSYTYPSTDTTSFNQTAPSSTHFTIGTNDGTNADGSEYRAHLFASVDKICKVDSFDGSNSDLTVTVGFQPRFLMVKAIGSGDWVVVDTARGWGSGNDKIMHLNSDSSISDADVGAPTSTGFTLTGNNADWNQSGKSYIYYAHA